MKRALTIKDVVRGPRRVRAAPSRPGSDVVEVTLQLPRDVWEALEAQGPRAVERLADAVVKAAKLSMRR